MIPRILRGVRLLGALAAVLLAAPSVAYLRISLDPGWALNKDFGQEYLLARALADGVDPYQPIKDLAARYLAPVGLLDKPFPTPHPPSIGFVFLPLLAVDYPTAVQVWFVVQVLCLLAGVALTLRTAQLPVNLAWVPIIAFALLAWRPVLVDLALGQVTIVILALLALSEFLLQRNHDRVAGIVLGVSMLFKPLAWPWLLVLLWRRSWTAAVACVGIALVGFVLPGFRIGLGPVVAYFTEVLPSISASYANEPTNISLWTVGPHLFGLTQLGRVIGAAVPLGVLATMMVWLRTRPPLGVALAVAACLSIVVSPISWQYSLVLLLLPLTELLNQLRRRVFPRVYVVVALVLAAALCAPTDAWPTALVSTVLAASVGVLLMWLARDCSPGWAALPNDLPHTGVVLAAAPYRDLHSGST